MWLHLENNSFSRFGHLGVYPGVLFYEKKNRKARRPGLLLVNTRPQKTRARLIAQPRGKTNTGLVAKMKLDYIPSLKQKQQVPAVSARGSGRMVR